jgi:oxygen-independent coproporphyrinogen-3 oxidase
LQRYEVSAFARPNHRCRHNLNYWRFGDYLGIGAGAHGKLSFAQRIVRQVRWREPAAYMQQALAGNAVSNQHEVARRELPFEFMLNALRLKDGFALADFSRCTGLPASAVEAGLAQAAEQGLIDAAAWAQLPAQVRPSVRGFDFLSRLQSIFLPASPRARQPQ